MRYFQFRSQLTEASPYLTGDELMKDRNPDRKETFLNFINNPTPFKTKDGKEIIIPPKIALQSDPPTEYDNVKVFTTWAAGKNKTVPFTLYGYDVKDTEQTPIPINTKNSVSPLIKGAEFGGSKFVAGGKEAASLKPADIGIDAGGAEYTAESLLQAIKGNQKLQATEIGRKVIDAATQIANKDNTFDLSELSSGEFAAFRDDAGEYLGPLMMLKGMATFTGDVEQAFFDHVGLTSFDQMKMVFPTAKNARLADAEGAVAGFENPVSGNKIWISVKGGKSGKGAAFSMGQFEVPKELKEKNPRAVAFLELQDKTTTKNSAFLNANFFYKMEAQGFRLYMDREITESEISEAIAGKTFPKYLDTILDKLKVNNFAKFLEDKDNPVQKYKNIFYAFEALTSKVVNKDNALPNFAPVVRETLQQNFIKLSNKMAPQNISDANAMNSVITWPNREMATGQVEVAVSSSMKEGPRSKLRMKVN